MYRLYRVAIVRGKTTPATRRQACNISKCSPYGGLLVTGARESRSCGFDPSAAPYPARLCAEFPAAALAGVTVRR